jgi:4-diphosphocytidyl-2-C-methyl-D-erythritol kinase
MQIKAYSKVTPLLKIYKKKQNDTKHRIMGIFGINKTIYDLVKISQSRKNKDEINYFANKKKIRISNCRVRVALSYLRKHFKIPFYKCQIYKQIPLSSGLGGSATDAASVIKFVLNKNNISLKQLDLKQIAFEIGSDVPFFILGKE